MKGLYTYIIFAIVLSLGVFYSCQDGSDIYKDYIKDGEIIYTNKVDTLKATSGKNRVLVSGYLSNAYNVKEVVVTWDKEKNKQIFPYTKSNNQTDKLDLIVTGLAEGNYVFVVYSRDKDGNKSVPETLYATAYGEKFESNLNPRVLKEHTAGTDSIDLIFAITGDSYERDTEIKYTTKAGVEKSVKIEPNEDEINITDVDTSKPISYRTFYSPTQVDEDGNETTIDFFPSHWSTITI